MLSLFLLLTGSFCIYQVYAAIKNRKLDINGAQIEYNGNRFIFVVMFVIYLGGALYLPGWVIYRFVSKD